MPKHVVSMRLPKHHKHQRYLSRLLDAGPRGGIKANIGCGDDVRKDWLNIDFYNRSRGVRVHDLLRTPWPIRDETVDFALLDNVFEHFPPLAHNGKDAALTALQELGRILKPGGHAVASVPDPRNPQYQWGSVTHYRAFDRRCFDYLNDPVTNTNDAIFRPPLRLARVLVRRAIRFTRLFDTGYHLPKYVSWDPNIGPGIMVTFIFQKHADGAAGMRRPRGRKRVEKVA